MTIRSRPWSSAASGVADDLGGKAGSQRSTYVERDLISIAGI